MAFDVSYNFIAKDMFTGAARRIGSSLDKVNKKALKVNRSFGKMGRSMRRAGKNMGTVGRDMTLKLSAPIGILGALTLKTAADFELAMNSVQALTSATGAEFKALKEEAKRLGKTTQFSAAQAAGGMQFLAKAGFNSQKVLAAMPETLKLATAASLDLASAADIVTNIMASQGIEAKDLGRVNDVLVKSFTSANTDLLQLGQAFKFAGSIAASAGLSFEETSSILAVMGNVGIQATMAGTSLRGAISRLLSPTKKIKDTLKGLKIRRSDILDSNGNLKSMIGVIEILEKRGANAAQLMEIFGQRAGPAFAALIQQGSKSIKDFKDNLDSAGGITNRIAKVQMKGLTGATRRLTSAFSGLQITMGEGGALKGVTSFTNGMASLIGKVEKLDPGILNLILGFLAFLAVIGPIAIALGAIVSITGTLITAFTAIAGVVIPAVAAGFAFLMTPVGLILGGITLLSIAVMKFSGAWDAIMNAIANTGPIKKILSMFDRVKGFLGTVKNSFQGTGDFFAESDIRHSLVDPNVLGGNKSQNAFSGVLDVNIKDKGDNVQSARGFDMFGGLDLGVSGI